eukprot:5482413-Amphidinium_carterae.1
MITRADATRSWRGGASTGKRRTISKSLRETLRASLSPQLDQQSETQLAEDKTGRRRALDR